jgi:hypothetical protein
MRFLLGVLFLCAVYLGDVSSVAASDGPETVISSVNDAVNSIVAVDVTGIEECQPAFEFQKEFVGESQGEFALQASISEGLKYVNLNCEKPYEYTENG